MKFLFMVSVGLMSMTVNAKTIVVLGDSISAGYGIDVNAGWVSLLEKKLNENGAHHVVHNESISGDTSAGGLARLNHALDFKPTIFILELGANDGLRGFQPSLIKNNLTQIIQRAQQTGAKVVLLSMKIPPNYGDRYITLFYDIYPHLAKELNTAYVPFIMEDVALTKAMMQADGLHPNEKGQPAIMNKVLTEVLPLLK